MCTTYNNSIIGGGLFMVGKGMLDTLLSAPL